ncbi:MAG TPA: acyl--CoA ligase [Alphaproteobacteria bacterium]|nr:acyl--CoA ligase [Alphaproteobacteria bacterium]
MTQFTIRQLLDAGRGDAIAIAAPSAPGLTYDRLRDQIAGTLAALNAVGIGRNDRVAIVLPNGPEMATAFMGVASAATSAPLNPGYRSEEFEFYLSDLGARALIVDAGSGSPAIDVARKLGIAVFTARSLPEQGAGRFILETAVSAPAKPRQGGPAEADDVALVLHTSGTTSRPKIVPLSQRNVWTSARNISRWVSFSPSDRGLTIMPLFHIHGLLAGILAPLSAGSSVFCTPGFNALKFFSWMDEAHPTWYTAVPTMHQAILTRATHNRDIIKANPLRFIRSSSSPLPPQVIAELEATFGAPVIEAYGMTEAAHQMACNPLPPAMRKPGTVGLPAGQDVAIMDTHGNLLSAGEVGEIVIKGENVTSGYENSPKANEDAFANGWFRTGDQGVKDADGYISVTGRLKEIINRGGEKISPREVDEVLMNHPAVLQVVTFGIPHDKLGEEVGALVVLREGLAATERELRDFVAERLADFKVPRRLLFMDDIPKGATGKLQRIGLAKKLGLG